MLLVLLGTQPHPFNRLIEQLYSILATDTLGKLGITEVIIQSGGTNIPPHEHVQSMQNLAHADYLELISRAKIVITHGGAGSMFDALRMQKKVIAMARLAEYNEHVDDHQVELVQQLAKEHYLIAEPTLVESFGKLQDYPFISYIGQQEQAIQQLAKIIS